MSVLENELRSTFGFKDFKSDAQRQAAEAIYKGSQNVIISMPPGSGKSFCYQLAAAVQKSRIAIVIHFILSEIENEMEFLRKKGIDARSLIGITGKKERDLYRDLLSGSPKTKVLFASIYSSQCRQFQGLIYNLRNNSNLSYIIIEDANYIRKSNFYIDSSYINDLLQCMRLRGSAPAIIVTPTVTESVMNEILHKLQVKSCLKYFQLTVNPKFTWDVWFTDTLPDPYEHLEHYLIQCLGLLGRNRVRRNYNTIKKRGIIYCRTKQTAEDLAAKLNRFGIYTKAYHNGVKSKQRAFIKQMWMSGLIRVITVAQILDASLYNDAVRCIVHWTIPQSILDYYDECARAGRSDEKIYCRIYFSSEEYITINYLIKTKFPERKDEFEESVTYCLGSRCRRVAISEHFQNRVYSCEHNCDICIDRESTSKRIAKFEAYTKKNNLTIYRKNNLTTVKIYPTKALASSGGSDHSKTVSNDTSCPSNDSEEEIWISVGKVNDRGLETIPKVSSSLTSNTNNDDYISVEAGPSSQTTSTVDIVFEEIRSRDKLPRTVKVKRGIASHKENANQSYKTIERDGGVVRKDSTRLKNGVDVRKNYLKLWDEAIMGERRTLQERVNDISVRTKSRIPSTKRVRKSAKPDSLTSGKRTSFERIRTQSNVPVYVISDSDSDETTSDTALTTNNSTRAKRPRNSSDDEIRNLMKKFNLNEEYVTITRCSRKNK